MRADFSSFFFFPPPRWGSSRRLRTSVTCRLIFFILFPFLFFLSCFQVAEQQEIENERDMQERAARKMGGGR
jgi:hypothetical protein